LIDPNFFLNAPVKRVKHNEKKMKTKNKNIRFVLFAAIVFFAFWSCSKNENESGDLSGFILSSPEIGADSLLPTAYTCDGESATLPLIWTGAPQETVSFALIMHHEASPADIHWYWVLYNIPAAVTSLSRNIKGIGTLGTNSVNDRTEYAPPCSQGPGIKAYTYTVYALSQNPSVPVPSDQVTREVLLTAISGITISSAKMTVYYSRNIK
jgi:phosphatidylethanolamine-binding protein (PEBP) family uncharacterized protein